MSLIFPPSLLCLAPLHLSIRPLFDLLLPGLRNAGLLTEPQLLVHGRQSRLKLVCDYKI